MKRMLFHDCQMGLKNQKLFHTVLSGKNKDQKW